MKPGKQELRIHTFDRLKIDQITKLATSTNTSRYLNLNFNWVLNIPEADPGLFYSRNNWTHNGVDFLSRDITYDAEGKVSTSTIQYEFPTRNVVSQYYYTKPD